MKANSDKGYMTIEASVIVPVILFATMLMIIGLVLTYEKARLLSIEYKALYTIPLDDIRSDSVDGYIGGKNYNDGIAYGNVSVDTSYAGHRAKCDGTVELYGTVSANGDHEIDVLSDRLRRWQLYDSLAEK
jgi:hypothetical protein